MIFCSLNLVYSIGRAKLDFPGKINEYVGSMQMLALFASFVISFVMLIAMKPLSRFMELNTNLILLLVFNMVIYPVIPLWGSKFKYQYRYKENIGITAYITIASVLISLLVILQFQSDRYYAKILGAIITTAILSISLWIISVRKRYLCVNTTYWKYGLTISLPLVLHTLSLNVLAQSDRIMITKFVGAKETGIYSLAYNYAILVNIVLGAVNDAWLPWFHDTLFERNNDAIRMKVKPLIMLGCFLGMGCISIAPEAIFILGPAEYQSGRLVVGPVVLGVICQFIYQQYVHIEMHEKKTKYISFGTVLAGITNVVLNLIFIPMFGYLAAAFTTMLCYFILMFVHLFITKKILKISLYDDLFMFVALFASAALTAIFMSLYNTVILRYSILLILCAVFMFANRKNVISFCDKRKQSRED